MGFAVKQIDHLELFVKDVAASVEWYKRALGMKVLGRDGSSQIVGNRGVKLELNQAAKGQTTGELETWQKIVFGVDRVEFEEAQLHLTRLAIPYRGPIDHCDALSIYLRDPDGHPLEIAYYL